MVDIAVLANRLDADERLKLSYRFPVREAGGEVRYETREGRLLDIAEEAKLLYVSHNGDVIWVKLEEVVDILPDQEDGEEY